MFRKKKKKKKNVYILDLKISLFQITNEYREKNIPLKAAETKQEISTKFLKTVFIHTHTHYI